MAVEICPTVTEEEVSAYNRYARVLAEFASRLHLDYADGIFAPRRLAGLAETDWPSGVKIDVHLMLRSPQNEFAELFRRQPYTIIIHAEVDGGPLPLVRQIKSVGLRAGVAFLPETSPNGFAAALAECDYALIFGGRLGYQGGQADLRHLDKAGWIHQLYPHVEIAWDGGVNDDNAAQIAAAGVSVLNTGGFIKKAADPRAAYAILEQIVKR